ncbi:putative ribonuclease H-like domain-containing protein [Tanacetum coccineum]
MDELVVSAVQGHEENAVKSSACWIWRPTGKVIDHISKDSESYMPKRFDYGNLQYALQDQGIFDSGCSRHMTGNKSYLTDYQDIDGGFVTFARSPKGGKITGKGKIRTGKLDFKDVYFVKKLKFNLFSVSQMCDKKNSVLFTETECLILSPDFKLLDESQVLLKVPRQNNMYSFNLKNVVPSGGLTCLFAKATMDESNLWHRRLGHVNFKTMNKLVRGNLVRGLPSKRFENHHTCVACQKGKQHKASCKTKLMSSISQPLQMLHMDLFGLIFVKSLNKKMYCLVVTDDFSSFCEIKGIKREFSVARTPQQNGVAERKNRTLIEAARTMLVDSLLPTTFWAEAINTACYVQNRVLITKPHNKTLYELLIGRSPNLDFMRPFGCPVTILNTLDHLGIETNVNAVQTGQEKASNHEYILLPFLTSDSQGLKSSDDEFVDDAGKKNDAQYLAKDGDKNGHEKDVRDQEEALRKQLDQETERLVGQGEATITNNTNRLNTVSPSISAAGQSFDNNDLPTDPFIPDLEDSTCIFRCAYDNEDVGAEGDLNNLETTMNVSLIPTTRIHKDHPKDQIIRDINSAIQTRRMINFSEENAMVSYISKQRRTNHKDYQNCLFACFLSQIEPKKTLVDLPKGKRAIGTKWVYRNKKDERGIVVRNKARMVAQGYTQEEGINYDEVFAPVARIEAIRLFLAYTSFMGFIVYQMDVKIAFLYGTIEEEEYVCQPPGFEDPQFPDKVYKVEKALYGLHQAPRAWYETLSTYLIENGFRRGTIDKTLFIKKDKGDILLVQVYVDDIIFGSTKKSLCDEFEQMMHKKFQMSSMGELTFFLGLQVQQKKDGIFISQDKYVVDILKKFDFITMKTTSTLTETNKALIKDEEAENVDVHLYRSMIGSLMYLTASRPDIMFAVCACARFQVTPKTSHLHAVKRIFRYLKGQPKLGLWYPRDSPFDLEAFSDSDYARASLDRKSTTGAEYVATANCRGQVLWIQNQMLDYGFNFMNTKIYIDNESTICIVKNPVFYSKTKHIEIRHHFIRDSYEKKLIQVIKIHTYHNVADLLTKNIATSKTVNLVKQIHSIVDGKAVVITESSVRNDLLFDDEDGITCLTNDEIYENLALMGYEQLSTKLTFQKGTDIKKGTK